MKIVTELLHKAEDSLAGVYKGAPKLSDSTKETLVKAWPWLALIFGVLQVLAAWWLFSWARRADELIDSVNQLYRSIGATYDAGGFTVWVWVAIAVLALDGIILLMAYPKLVKRQKGGWDLLFLGALINVLYAVVSLFLEDRGGIGTFLLSLVGSAIAFWLLFAVRDKYKA